MKLFHQVARQWRLGAMLACVCVLMFAGLQLTADDSGQLAPEIPDAPEAVATDEGTINLDGQIEITVNGGIRSRTRTTHSTSVVVRNISEEPIEGPLALVIDATGLDALELEESDGKLASGEPYLELLGENGTLRAGATLRPKRVEYESEAAIPLAERNGFAPEFRVVRLSEADLEDDLADNENLPGKSYSQEDLDRVMAIQDAWNKRLMSQGHGGVFGTATAEDDQGNLVVRVYTERPAVIRDLPGDVDGIPLQQEVIGEPFKPGPTTSTTIYLNGESVETQTQPEPDDGDDGPPVLDSRFDDPNAGDDEPQFTGTPYDPTVRFDRPVPIGVSSFNLDIGICATGTLGCRLVDSLGQPFALSNNHVWGGYLNIFTFCLVAIPGDRVVQPGPLDAIPICSFNALDTIGTVSDFEPIFLAPLQICAMGLAPVNYMDATIMRASPGAVHYCTPPDGYGHPQRAIAGARLGMKVQKYGRTNVYTSGQITAINGTTCVGPYVPNGFGYFERQIEITNTTPFGQPFSGGGDSGSLIVAQGGEDNGKPVGLLFAGGGNGIVDTTIANPIGYVLTRFGMQVDDGSGAPGAGEISGTSGGVISPLDPPPPLP